MEYLKVFTGFLEDLEPLNMEERGRLFTAMLEYAKDGTAPQLQGNERFVWPGAKRQINLTLQAYENKVGGAAKARARKLDIKDNQVDIKGNQEQSALIGLDKPQVKQSKAKQSNAMQSNSKHKHGTYQNVLLTDEELAKLQAEFPDWEARVERVSEYVAKTGKTYKNYLAVIRSWARNDKEEKKNPNEPNAWMQRYIADRKKKGGYQPDWNDPKRDEWLKKCIDTHTGRVSVSQYAREKGITYEQAVQELADTGGRQEAVE